MYTHQIVKCRADWLNISTVQHPRNREAYLVILRGRAIGSILPKIGCLPPLNLLVELCEWSNRLT